MNSRVPLKRVGFSEVMETYSTATNYPTQMAGYRPSSPQTGSVSPADNAKECDSPRNVSFGKLNREQEKDKRQKYLTARYGQHQMMLIRKRLAVEDWLYEKLRDMYNCENDADDHDCKLDLEDILNLDSDSERQQYASENLIDAKQPRENVNKFIQELLQKAKTL